MHIQVEDIQNAARLDNNISRCNEQQGCCGWAPIRCQCKRPRLSILADLEGDCSESQSLISRSCYQVQAPSSQHPMLVAPKVRSADLEAQVNALTFEECHS